MEFVDSTLIFFISSLELLRSTVLGLKAEFFLPINSFDTLLPVILKERGGSDKTFSIGVLASVYILLI